MPVITLREFYQPNGQHRALEAYSQFPKGTAWSVPAKMTLYKASRAAFGDEADENSIAFSQFETIYDELRGYWQVFRSSVPAQPWPAKTVYETLRTHFRDLPWGGPINLPTFWTSGKHESLLLNLMAMKGIKSNSTYPNMTVSKFLHFYNPSLFPIYDYEVIWRKVFKRFKNCYAEFERTAGLSYRDDDGSFLRNYICWASSLMCDAHPDFMNTFVDWIEAEVPRRQFDELGRDVIATLYATAFEFTAIGAAVGQE
jgi:hypothetical protein